MTTGDQASRLTPSAASDDAHELEREIEQTREQLGETVEQLAAKADVKKKVRDKAAQLRGQAQAATGKTAQQARHALAEGAGHVRRRKAPVAMAVAVAALAAGYLALRRWRNR
jgi:chromosome segregation ATPase